MAERLIPWFTGIMRAFGFLCKCGPLARIYTKIRTNPNNRSWILLGSSSLALGTHWLATRNAVAHDGPHGNEAEHPTDYESGEHHVPAPDTADVETSSSSPEKTDMGSMAIPSSEAIADGENSTPLEEIPVTQQTSVGSVSSTSVSDGFSIGLGESLLGLMIAGPFLLMSLKKQLQS